MSVLCGACWMPRSSKIDDALGLGDAPRDGAHVGLGDAGARAVVGDRDVAQDGAAARRRRRCARRGTPWSTQVLLRRAPRAARRGRTRRCPAAPGGGCRRASAVSVRRGSMTTIVRAGIVGDRLQDRSGRAGSRATATGSCRRTPRPRRARSRVPCGSAGARRAGRRPRTRRSSPARARSTRTRIPSGGARRRARSAPPRWFPCPPPP